MPTPNLDTAAIEATKLLITRQIKTTPIDTLALMKNTPNVLLLSFAEIALLNNVNRDDIISLVGDKNQDALTAVSNENGTLSYTVMYNQLLPHAIVQKTIGRELGHIILGHDGSRSPEVRTAEAECFARHLICPRPILRMIEESGLRITVELVGALTGCRRRCLDGIHNTPGTRVPAELNRMVKEQFADCVKNFVNYARHVQPNDTSEIVDFGSYFDNYTE